MKTMLVVFVLCGTVAPAALALWAWRRRALCRSAPFAGLVLGALCLLAAGCTAESTGNADAAQQDGARDADGGVDRPSCNVIFASGFEGRDVRFEGVYDPYIVGVDTVFDQLYPGRANWSALPFADTTGGELPGAYFNHIVGNRSFNGVGGMSGDHAYTEIVEGVAFSGTSSLHPVVINAIPEDLGGQVRSQWEYNLVPDHGLERGYVGFRLRLQPDVVAIAADNGPGGDWQTLFQLRERFGGCEPETMYSAQVELNYQADTGLRFWTHRGTHYCMGSTYEGSETSQQLVPTDGAWHHYEFFWDRDAGLFRWKLDGEVVVDWVGVRMKVAGPMQVLKPIYTYVSEPWEGDATRQTVERWYDDFFLCDDRPAGF